MSEKETEVKEKMPCSIFTPTITEKTAILSFACEKQIFHPLRMPVSQGKSK